MAKKPLALSLVKFECAKISKRERSRYPFKREKVYIFIGEIRGMRGHCVVAEYPVGKMYSGYHTENFRELKRAEM